MQVLTTVKSVQIDETLDASSTSYCLHNIISKTRQENGYLKCGEKGWKV